MTQPRVQFALDFPQGHILFLGNQGAYFLPHHSMDAFQIWGERKELFGKNAITVRGDRTTGAESYSVVHEFANDGKLLDARLVGTAATFHGQLADAETINNLNGALAQNALNLHSVRDTEPDRIFNAARFADGRLLIQLHNRNELYIGTPGNFEKVDAQLYVQGGNSMYYRTPEGEKIDLPYGYGGPNGEAPSFKGEFLAYIKVNDNGDPAQFGLEIKRGIKHLSPFSPEVAVNQKPAAPQPKP